MKIPKETDINNEPRQEERGRLCSFFVREERHIDALYTVQTESDEKKRGIESREVMKQGGGGKAVRCRIIISFWL